MEGPEAVSTEMCSSKVGQIQRGFENINEFPSVVFPPRTLDKEKCKYIDSNTLYDLNN